ncbi:MAG: transcriptional regulator [Deltaproteobacteria bacterium]|nr:transcriptional regulator [Deltaproteobacteria bacterium]
MPTVNYKDYLYEELKDKDYAAGYLTACYEDSLESFLVGLRDVVEVHGGVRELSNTTELNRENLYKLLSEEGNPKLASLHSILSALGFKLQINVATEGKKEAA